MGWGDLTPWTTTHCFPSMRYDLIHMVACSEKFKRVVCWTALHDQPYQDPSSENCTNTCWLCRTSPFFSQIRLMAASLKWCSRIYLFFFIIGGLGGFMCSESCIDTHLSYSWSDWEEINWHVVFMSFTPLKLPSCSIRTRWSKNSHRRTCVQLGRASETWLLLTWPPAKTPFRWTVADSHPVPEVLTVETYHGHPQPRLYRNNQHRGRRCVID